MKRIIVILAILMLMPLVFIACAANESNSQASNEPERGEPEIGNSIDIKELFNDLGKTLDVLKTEHPGSEIRLRDDGFPNNAAACLEESEGGYAYSFFGMQDGDFEKAMSELESRLKCAGFITTAGVIFPDMTEEMPFSDFFSLIGVSDYEFFGSDQSMSPAQGWLYFTYENMEVWLNTNDFTGGIGKFTGAQKISRSAPVSITNKEILTENETLAYAVMFD